VSFAITAEHRATTQFRCATSQTLTLGKISMFQFFVFSDSQYTDVNPGVLMTTTGRIHANGNLGLDGLIRIDHVSASGNIGCIGTPPAVGTTGCDEPDVFIGSVPFARENDWPSTALTTYENRAQDAAHGVPRLQLPVVGQPLVQRGYNAANAVVANVNAATVNGTNLRLLVDPVRSVDTPEIRRQKFAHQADIRVINGAWYLKNPDNENDWPGVIIWSDHGVRQQSADGEFVAAARNIGQKGPSGLASSAPVTWGTDRPPQRFSYYGIQLGAPTELSRNLGTASSPLNRAPPMQTAVVSYGALFRDASDGQNAATWRPGLRTVVDGPNEAWCEAIPNSNPRAAIIDALAVASGEPSAPCTNPPGGLPAPTEAAALLAATRSGFRDGFAEILACGDDDNVTDNPTSCDGAPPNGDRRRGNMLPMNFDVHAFQEALADTSAGELGSYFCRPDETTCAAFMKRPFNGIVYLAAPYPGSEAGYGVDGGTAAPDALPIPQSNHADHLQDAALAAGAARADEPLNDNVPFPPAGAVPLFVDHGDDDAPGDLLAYEELRDDEVAALPYPLCSDGAVDEKLSGGGYVFTRPDCANPEQYTRINAVRIINARRINTNAAPSTVPPIQDSASLPGFATQPVLSAAGVGQLPVGLSIVSNLPVYVVGDVNLTSDAAAALGSIGAWVPVLVGGDVVHLLSNAWDDQNARWAVSNGQQTRRASVTRYHMAILGGWGMTDGTSLSGGVQSFPRLLEDWSSGTVAACRGTADFTTGCPAVIYGSMVVGFQRVYTNWPLANDNEIGRRAPRRDWRFDEHLNLITNQPPGTPLFNVSAVREWTRR
jgi:hypothetical protein